VATITAVRPGAIPRGDEPAPAAEGRVAAEVTVVEVTGAEDGVDRVAFELDGFSGCLQSESYGNLNNGVLPHAANKAKPQSTTLDPSA